MSHRIRYVVGGEGAPFSKPKISRVLSYRQLYRGEYVDPYNVVHTRHDLRILPEDWSLWDQSEFYTSLKEPTP